MSRCSNIPAAYVVLLRKERVLLLKRANTGFRDGEYSFIAGHVEEDESFTEAAIREAREEAGITIRGEDLKAAHVMHRNSDDAVRVDIFFTAENWTGEITNREPEKCSDLSWFPLDSLPENTIPYIRRVIECIRKKTFYSEEGWLPAS
ncbi:MAG: NUDIX domain-containing protein [Spirochaetales bacterium]|nr:NUDIX domain-containing protein [Spirochaetales bacterium]